MAKIRSAQDVRTSMLTSIENQLSHIMDAINDRSSEGHYDCHVLIDDLTQRQIDALVSLGFNILYNDHTIEINWYTEDRDGV